MSNKWIAWHGLDGKAPISGEAKVLDRDGDAYSTSNAEDLIWLHANECWDIMAYQVSGGDEDFKEVVPDTDDAVNNPKHYTSHPSGVECLDVTRHFSFNLGNAMKYIWRCDLKKDAIEDLRKAIFYLNDEINLRLSKKQC
jgi:hypothetical protein